MVDTRQVSSRVYFRYEGKKQNMGGQGRLVMQGSDAMRMELRDPLGRLQYVATLSEHQFVARYPRQNVAYLDQISGGAYLRRLLGIQVSFQELKDLLIGIVPATLKKAKFDSWEWNADEGVYVGVFKLNHRRVECGIDPKRAALAWMKITGEKASDAATIKYSEFDSCCRLEGNGNVSQFPLAHTVSLQMAETGTSVSLEWQDVETFKDPKPAQVFKAELPETTKRVMLN